MTIKNYVESIDDEITSDIITNDEGTQGWSLTISPGTVKGFTDDKINFSVHNRTGFKAMVGYKLTVDKVVESNFRRMRCWHESQYRKRDEIMTNLRDGKDMEILLELTNLEKLTTYYGSNTFKVNWTIYDFSPTVDQTFGYKLDWFSCADYPGAEWSLTHREGQLTLTKSSKENNVKLKATVEMNGKGMVEKPITGFIDAYLCQVVSQWKNECVSVGKFGMEYVEQSVLGEMVFEMVIVFDVTNKMNLKLPYFKTIFNAGLDEAKKDEWLAKEFDLTTIENVLKYSYYGSGPVKDVKSALVMLRIAHRYQMTDLIRFFKQYVCEHLTGDDVISALIVADWHESKGLFDACKILLEKEAMPLADYPNYRDLKKGRHFDILAKLYDCAIGNRYSKN